MKHKLSFIIVSLILISLVSSNCKKESSLQDELAKLPPPTQTGENTFGCLVNGKAWVA